MSDGNCSMWLENVVREMAVSKDKRPEGRLTESLNPRSEISHTNPLVLEMSKPPREAR